MAVVLDAPRIAAHSAELFAFSVTRRNRLEFVSVRDARRPWMSLPTGGARERPFRSQASLLRSVFTKPRTGHDAVKQTGRNLLSLVLAVAQGHGKALSIVEREETTNQWHSSGEV